MSSLSDNDKFKVSNAKSSFIKNEIDLLNATLLEIKKNNTSAITTAISSAINTATSQSQTQEPSANIDNIMNRILTNATIAAKKTNPDDVVINNPINPVKNLNPTNTTVATVNDVCNRYAYMPEPDVISFTESTENMPMTSDNKSYQSYIWCKCNGDDGINNNTSRCKNYKICRDHYNKFKESTINDVSKVEKQIYDDCITVFPNYPKYLEVNSLK